MLTHPSENQRGITASQTGDNLNINKNIKTSLLDTAPQIQPQICTQLTENADGNSTRLPSSKLFKIEAQLSALKSYVSCDISSLLHSKIESISQSLQVTLKVFQQRETKTNEFFHQNMTFLQNDRMSS